MRAVFLDRDGVINENRSDHVKAWDEFQFIPRSLDAIRLLRSAGYMVFVTTNQAIVSRGLITAQALEDIHSRMIAQISAHGGKIHDLRYCPHDVCDGCTCRKPCPGMLLDLAAHWNIDLNCATMIGDAWTDIGAARAAGCRAVLVRTGRGTEQLRQSATQQHHADAIAADLWESVCWLLRQESAAQPQREPDPIDPARGRIAVATPLGGAR